MRMKFAGAVPMLGVLALAACSSSGRDVGGGGSTPSTIHVGAIPVSDVVPLYIAQGQGYFKDEGLTVKVTTVQNASAVVPAVMNGQLQVGTVANVPFLVAKSRSLPIQAVVGSANTSGKAATDYSGLFVRKGSPIERPRDLEGKKVATNNLKNVMQLAVDETVRDDGGDPSKVHFVPMPFPDMVTALKKRQVDAIGLVEPFYSEAAANGGTLLNNVYTTAYPANTSLAFFVASTKWLHSHSTEAKKFQTAITKAGQYAASHPDAVRRVMVNKLQIEQDLASNVRLPKYGQPLETSSLETVAKLMVEQGFISKVPPKGDLVWQP